MPDTLEATTAEAVTEENVEYHNGYVDSSDDGSYHTDSLAGFEDYHARGEAAGRLVFEPEVLGADTPSPYPGSNSSYEDSDVSDEDEEDLESGQSPPDLRTRLAAFIPKMAKANETLEALERVEDVDEDEERYIEMDLGLGVLAEKHDNVEGIRTKESESESSSEDESKHSPPLSPESMQEPPQKKRKIEEVS